ncbi:MAG: hypothetical protein JW741_31315 [Sedimentisphaerales bacterium]|nr:hypothetical protein [Sedimentisphaerales bacterium]
MRPGAKVRIVVLIACVGVTIYEIPSVRRIWRYADMGRPRGGPAAKESVPHEVAATDPEAADILRYCLNEPNDAQLAQWVQKYPENEFFLAQLAQRLTDANCVDPRAALALADKLVTLSPENAHYRYLKGWILLSQPWAPGREEEAVEQFELGNGLPQLYLPRTMYAERIEGLAGHAGISALHGIAADFSDTKMYAGLFMFLGHGKQYVQFDPSLLRRLTKQVSQMGSRFIDNTAGYSVLDTGFRLILVADGLRLRQLELSEDEARLSRYRLCQAHEIKPILKECFNRPFHVLRDTVKLAWAWAPASLAFSAALLAWLALLPVNRVRGRANRAQVAIGGYVMFGVGLTGVFGLLLLRSYLGERFGGQFYWSLGFAGSAVVLWGLLLLLSRVRPVDPLRFRRSRRWAAIVCGLLWLSGMVLLVVDTLTFAARYAGVHFWLERLGFVLVWSILWIIIWAIASYRHHVFRAIPYARLLRNRVVQLLFVLALTAGLLTFPISEMTRSNVLSVVWSVIVLIVTSLSIGIVCTHVSDGRIVLLDGLRRFFDKTGQILATRAKVAQMMSVLLIISWVILLATNHLAAHRVQELEDSFVDPLSSYRPLPQASHDTYERVALRADPRSDSSGGRNVAPDATARLGLAAPSDLARIISACRTSGKPLGDGRLFSLLNSCGRDARSIVLDALEEPTVYPVLRTRAEWGDESVKDRLEQVFEEDMAAFVEQSPEPESLGPGPSRLESLLYSARILARISDGQEAEDRLSRLMEAVVQKVSETPNPPAPFEAFAAETPEARQEARKRDGAYAERRNLVQTFWEALGVLPKPRAARLLTSYLQQTQFADLAFHRDLEETAEVICRLADSQLAEEVFQRVAASPPVQESYDIPVGRAIRVDEAFPKRRVDFSHVFLEAVYASLSDAATASLLEHLTSDSDVLRAFVVWRLTSLGYEWSAAQLRTLRQDECWKVRLNALFAGEIQHDALGDRSGVVRAVARALAQPDVPVD